jgi:hypothetical protein
VVEVICAPPIFDRIRPITAMVAIPENQERGALLAGPTITPPCATNARLNQLGRVREYIPTDYSTL